MYDDDENEVELVGTIESSNGMKLTLTTEGWSCADTLFAKVMDQLYPFDSGGGPADGTPGFLALTNAHKALGGTVHYFEDDQDAPPDAVY